MSANALLITGVAVGALLCGALLAVVALRTNWLSRIPKCPASIQPNATMGGGIAAGIAIGTALGLVLHNLTLGIALGASIGIAISTTQQARHHDE